MDSWMFIIAAYLGGLVIIIFLIAAVIGAFLRSKKRSFAGPDDRNWYLQVALSRRDALSQWFLVLGSLALANFFYVVNNNFGAPFSWRMVLLAGVFILAITAYLGKSVYCAAIGIIGFLVWWAAQTMVWQGGNQDQIVSAIPAGLMWLAILLYIAGLWQARAKAWKRFATVYSVIGLVLANFLLFFFSTHSGLEAIEEMTSRPGLFESWENTISLFVIGAVAIMAVLYAGTSKVIFNKEMFALMVLFVIFGIILVLPAQEMFSLGELSAGGLLWAAVLNFMLFAEIIGVVFSGYSRREIWMVNFGAVLLIIFTAVKYFDWFFKFMDKSFFFIFAGILLFSVGWGMERGRRYLAQSIRAQSNQLTQ